MMQADNNEKEEHLICVICKFEDSYLKDSLLKFRLQEARMLDNVIQHYWKLVVETLPYYNTVARWVYEFRRESEDVQQCHTAIIAVEQSVRKSV